MDKVQRYDPSDEDLVALLRQGDTDAFEALYDRYWHKLYAAAYKRIHLSDAAEGMVQDFFTTLWCNRRKLHISHSFAAYAHAAIRHLVFHHLEKEIVRRTYRSRHAGEAPARNSTEETVLERDLQARLEKAVTLLPGQCRSVFELSRQAHKTNKEIARELEISEKTVENHLNRALRILRMSLRAVLLWLLIGA